MPKIDVSRKKELKRRHSGWEQCKNSRQKGQERRQQLSATPNSACHKNRDVERSTNHLGERKGDDIETSALQGQEHGSESNLFPLHAANLNSGGRGDCIVLRNQIEGRNRRGDVIPFAATVANGSRDAQQTSFDPQLLLGFQHRPMHFTSLPNPLCYQSAAMSSLFLSSIPANLNTRRSITGYNDPSLQQRAEVEPTSWSNRSFLSQSNPERNTEASRFHFAFRMGATTLASAANRSDHRLRSLVDERFPSQFHPYVRENQDDVVVDLTEQRLVRERQTINWLQLIPGSVVDSSENCLESFNDKRSRSGPVINVSGKSDGAVMGSLILACPEDRGMLNDNLIFLRQQIEFFQATVDDIMSHTRGRNKGIAPQQVGIRCRHCNVMPAGQRRKGSTYFPSTLMGIYQAAQNINVEHLQSGVCPKMPREVEQTLLTTRATKRASSGAGKAYWAESARMQGLIDTDDGIRFAIL